MSLAGVAEYADLRRRSSMVHVLNQLGLEPNARGRYWCPHHDDEKPGGNPSADVWQTDDGELLACWSCEWRADVVELIREVRKVSWADALKKAKEWAPAPGSEPYRPKVKVRVSSDRLEREYEVTTQGVRYPGDRDPLELWRNARLNANRHCPPVEHLRDAWGWRGDFRGQLSIPWRARSGELIGIHYRIREENGGWRKGSRRGSRFDVLYGSELLLDQTEVWVCEGESDTTWASWCLHPLGVGTVGIGSASQRPCADDLELLQGRDVVLAFDGDRAGDGAWRRWSQELARYARSISRLKHDGDLCEDPLRVEQLREGL